MYSDTGYRNGGPRCHSTPLSYSKGRRSTSRNDNRLFFFFFCSFMQFLRENARIINYATDTFYISFNIYYLLIIVLSGPPL
jgi:hypothetical protein